MPPRMLSPLVHVPFLLSTPGQGVLVHMVRPPFRAEVLHTGLGMRQHLPPGGSCESVLCEPWL